MQTKFGELREFRRKNREILLQAKYRTSIVQVSAKFRKLVIGEKVRRNFGVLKRNRSKLSFRLDENTRHTNGNSFRLNDNSPALNEISFLLSKRSWALSET